MSEIMAAVEMMGRTRMDEKRFDHLCDVGVRLVVGGQEKVEVSTEELWALLGEIKEHRAQLGDAWKDRAQHQREMWLDTYVSDATGFTGRVARDGWDAAIAWVRGRKLAQCEALDDEGNRCGRPAGHANEIHRSVTIRNFGTGTPQ